MNEQEQLARQWAEYYEGDWPKFTPGTHASELVEKAKAAAEYILEHTAPPTMADVEWDHEKHHLAGAVFQNFGMTAEVVMFHKDGSGAIVAVAVEDGRPFIGDASKYTPNGKRYELREKPEHPEHPEVLETVEDYQKAPVGTVVTRETGGVVEMKRGADDWRCTGIWGSDTDFDMAGSIRRVLLWGPGGEA